jgi:N-acetylmuramoyl-L-alanine amidase
VFRFTTVAVVLAIVILSFRAASRIYSGDQSAASDGFHSPPPTPIASVLFLPFSSAASGSEREVGPPQIGVVAGHWQYDTGALCPDGLREVDINLAVAGKVVEILTARGYRAELLPEVAPAIQGYSADAFVSIHSDSCIWEASGFKVARVTHSAVPQLEDHLVESLYEAYEEVTGLPRHQNSITSHMTQYHNFRKIAPTTPGAIIELGFMGSDYDLLVNQQDRVALGVAEGIVRFLTTPMDAPAAEDLSE